MRYRFSLLFSLILILTGCGTFSSQPPAPPPVPRFTPALDVQTDWQIELGKRAQYVTLTPAYADGKLWVTTPQGAAVAVAAPTGKVLWRNQLPQPVTTGPGVGSGLVVVGTANAQLLALSQATGRLRWSASLSNTALATPMVTPRQVFVKTQDDRLYALDTHSGKVLWVVQQPVPDLLLRASGSPQAVGEQVVVGFANGVLATLAHQDGHIVWQSQLGSAFGDSAVENMADVVATPLIQNNTVYAAAYQGQLMALNLTNGQILWQQAFSSESGLAADEHQIYATDVEGNVWAFDADAGATEWKQNALAGRQLTAPVLLGQWLIVGDAQGSLYWLATDDGRLLAQTHIGQNGINAAPIVAGKAVYVYTNAGKLLKLQPVAPHA